MSKIIAIVILFTLPFFSSPQGRSLAWAEQINLDSWSMPMNTDYEGNVFFAGTTARDFDCDPGNGVKMIYTDKLALGIACYVVKLNPLGVFEWGVAIGDAKGIGFANVLPRSISSDIHGNILITGAFRGTVDFDPSDTGKCIISSRANINTTTFDAFVLKLSSTGVFLFATSFGSSISDDDEGRSIAADSKGNIYIGGRYTGVVDFDPDKADSFCLTSTLQRTDIFLCKLEPDGKFAWAKSMGGDYRFDEVSTVRLDKHDNLFIAGDFQSSGDFDPGPGVNILSSFGIYNMFISKFDSSGSYMWTKQFGGTEYCWPNNLEIDTKGNLVVIGSYNSDCDFDPSSQTRVLNSGSIFKVFLLRLDNDGDLEWVKDFNPYAAHSSGGSTRLSFVKLANAKNDIAVCGLFSGRCSFDSVSTPFDLNNKGNVDVFLARFDSLGVVRESHIIPSNISNNSALSFCTDKEHNLFISSNFMDTIDADPYSGKYLLAAKKGSAETFIIKLNADWNTGITSPASTSKISIYPNPSNGLFIISYKSDQNKTLSVFNILGELVSTKILVPGQAEESIDVSSLAKGMYIVRLGNATQKVIIE